MADDGLPVTGTPPPPHPIGELFLTPVFDLVMLAVTANSLTRLNAIFNKFILDF